MEYLLWYYEKLDVSIDDIKKVFRDMDFDIPAARVIKELPECAGFMGLPFAVYFKNSKAVAATTSIQNEKQIIEILDREFA